MNVDESRASAGQAAGWTRRSALVVGLCFLLNMLDGADVVILSFIAPHLAQAWRIAPQQLGLVFSASIAGMAIGCLCVAPQADRFGRRRLLIFALGLASTSMLASGFAQTLSQLMLARLLVGVGVGAVGVCMSAMVAEFAPERQRAFAVGFVQAGWPLAAIFTAFASAWLIPHLGWRPLLVGVGLFGLLFLPVVALLLPESDAFLRDRQRVTEQDIGSGPAPRRGRWALENLIAAPARQGSFRLPDLFRPEQRRVSLCLWPAVTLGYFVLYFAINWIPKLAADAGLGPAQAIYAGATLNIGAFCGTVLVGMLATRWSIGRVIAGYFVCAIVVLILFGAVPMPLAATLFTAFLIGFTVQGGFNGYWGLAAELYPVGIRGTGIGWALGVGRIGAVMGPIVGGLLVGARVSNAVLFGVFSLALAIAVVLCLLIPRPAALPAK